MKFFDGIDDLETEKEQVYDLPPLSGEETLLLFVHKVKKGTPPTTPDPEEGQSI